MLLPLSTEARLNQLKPLNVVVCAAATWSAVGELMTDSDDGEADAVQAVV